MKTEFRMTTRNPAESTIEGVRSELLKKGSKKRISYLIEGERCNGSILVSQTIGLLMYSFRKGEVVCETTSSCLIHIVSLKFSSLASSAEIS